MKNLVNVKEMIAVMVAGVVLGVVLHLSGRHLESRMGIYLDTGT